MSFRDRLNQLKEKAEELNRKHNLLPIGQNSPAPSQQHSYPPQQDQYQHQHQQSYYPGQQPQPYPHSYQNQGAHPQPHSPYPQQQQPPPPPPNYNTRPGVPPPIPSHSRPPPATGSVLPSSPCPRPDHGSIGGGCGGGSGTGVYWRPSFSPGIPVSHEWTHKQGHGDPYGWGNNELQNYTSSPANSFHTPDSTKLVVRAISSPSHPDPEQRFASARLVSRATLGRPDGCLTAWLTLPCAEGIWPAFWLLPREPFIWPHEGEVDIAETWNGDCVNHSCLHWGFYTPADAPKHLVRGTHVPDMSRPGRVVRFDFVWQCSGSGIRADGKSAGGGRLMWYVDQKPVMKNLMPPGTRPIEDWSILLNVAMGGNVCQGKTPREGSYDLVVHGLQMSDSLPEGGWGRFDHDWHVCPDGAIM
ncbi:glycoside hydrolase family 16 protein [Xylariaceae sp. FL0594]|nr:glycoside hydrolase family 16 protein [Xylariaceae sp. FL0594]